MNNYIMTTVSINGTEIEFFEKLRDFFIGNTVMPFTLESENLTNTTDQANFVKLVNEAYELEILSPCANDTATSSETLKFTLRKNNEDKIQIFAFSVMSYTQRSTRVASVPRMYPIFIIKGENFELLNISNYNSPHGKSNGIFYINAATSEVGNINAFITNISTGSSYSFTDYDTNTVPYILAPYHSISTATDTLIMDSELAIKNKNTNYYCGALLDCHGLGGGVKGNFYKDSEGTLLYCFETNCCTKLENKVEI